MFFCSRCDVIQLCLRDNNKSLTLRALAACGADAASINKFLELNVFPEPRPQPPFPSQHPPPPPSELPSCGDPEPHPASVPLAPPPPTQELLPQPATLDVSHVSLSHAPGSPSPPPASPQTHTPSPTDQPQRSLPPDNRCEASPGSVRASDSPRAPWLGVVSVLYLAALVCCTPMAAQEGWPKRLACLPLGERCACLSSCTAGVYAHVRASVCVCTRLLVCFGGQAQSGRLSACKVSEECAPSSSINNLF